MVSSRTMVAREGPRVGYRAGRTRAPRRTPAGAGVARLPPSTFSARGPRDHRAARVPQRAAVEKEGGPRGENQASFSSSMDESGDGDVYLVERRPLSEGVLKHTLLVFVSDESGIINRVSGVFSRRGFNIESLAVGLNVDKALFTVVVNCTTMQMTNLVKQISKLVKVKYVEDVTFLDRLERELMLIKVRAETNEERTEILQLAEVFRAKVVDIGGGAVTLSSAGDPGKTEALQRSLNKFGVMEVARTGKIALKRGMSTIMDSKVKQKQKRERKGERAGAAAGDESDGGASDPSAEDGEEKGGDVYMLDEDVSRGVWEVGYLTGEDHAVDPEGEDPVERHTMSLLVQDMPGVLQQVTSVFARRGYNVQSLAVGHAEERGLSRISLVVPGTQSSIDNLCKQLLKLVHCVKVQDLTDSPYVSRELMLIKCKCTLKQRREIIDLSEIFRSNICDISEGSVTVEIEGSLDKMAAFQDMLQPYDILEVARTGRIALSRESGVDTKFLATQETSQAY